MLLQQALRTTETPESLKTKYAIKYKAHGKYPNLIQFKYDMIESPMGEPIVQECRGVILDSANAWDVVARPFDKFFNSNEGHAAKIDWSTARVQEKVDGSLIIMYWYDDGWHVATSGTPDASGSVDSFKEMTFAGLFMETYKECGYSVPGLVEDSQLYPDATRDICFLFELTSPYNRVVVPHGKSNLTLLGARSRNGKEYNADLVARRYGFTPVKSYPLTSLEEVVASFEHIDPMRQEGYVVVDENFNRVKIKHPGYVAIHHIRGNDGPTPKKMLEIVRSGESSEILTYFPEWKPIHDEVKKAFESLASELEADFARCMSEVSDIDLKVQQKEFALRAVKTRCSSALFTLRTGKTSSIRTFLKEMDLNRLRELLRLGE